MSRDDTATGFRMNSGQMTECECAKFGCQGAARYGEPHHDAAAAIVQNIDERALLNQAEG